MRLEVTRRSDLAVKALVALARDGGRLKGSDLAKTVGATAGFLPQVLSPLVRQGWVGSDPGPTGGYSLRSDARDISVLAIIEATEGVTDTTTCVLADRPCSEHGPCSLHSSWSRARELLLDELAGVTVADLVAQET